MPIGFPLERGAHPKQQALPPMRAVYLDADRQSVTGETAGKGEVGNANPGKWKREGGKTVRRRQHILTIGDPGCGHGRRRRQYDVYCL